MPGKIKLTEDELKIAALFESTTGASVMDCIIDPEDDRIIVIVGKGEAGKAIGRNGSNIKRLKRFVGRNFEIVEYAGDPENFVRNIFLPAKISNVKILERNDRTLIVNVSPEDKGYAIGKNGKNIRKAKLLLSRHFNIDKVRII